MTAACPWCGRTVSVRCRRYTDHWDAPDSGEYCPLSGQPQPATGLTADDYIHRVRTITHLATQLRDRDPSLTYDYILSLSSAERGRLLMVALAGVNIDARISDMYGWVTDLPAANTNQPGVTQC